VLRAGEPRPGKLADDPRLRRYVEEKLRLRWWPQQISRRLIIDHPHDGSMRVSHETIYTSLFVQSKAVLKTELTLHLRTRRVRRRPQRRVLPRSQSRRIPDMVSISQRPDSVLDRTVPGHWEGDLLVGRYGRSHMVTLVERHSRYLLVLPLLDATTRTVVAAVTAAFQQLPPTMGRSLTWDRGVEMVRHADFTAATGITVYFCDAYCPWQRGSNETVTACCGSTSRRRPTYPNTILITSRPWSTSSTADHDKAGDGRLLTSSSGPPVLR
jgi:transposase, IS30 family